MGNVYLLDCTLRDGGYVNNWNFGEDAIKGFSQKIAQTCIDFFEVGFLKGNNYDPNIALFPDVQSIARIISPKSPMLKYVAMIDMSNPVPLANISPYDGTSIDGIRVIFKKDKIDQAFEYCREIQKLGYFISVNFVCTDQYSDKEIIEGIEKFNVLKPFALSIVDTFGVIKRKQFLRLAYIADNNMADNIALAYHAHNNLQHALGNAEALVEMNLKRDLIIDACVFGMGRGAGNLNLELFAEYMNENYDKHYKIEPMLEIMDEYLNDIYITKFWGYSLPLYLSAATGSHPDYAIYLAEKNTLTVKSFNELLQGISDYDKLHFSKEKAETYYRAYHENYFDDRNVLQKLGNEISGRQIIILAPGKKLSEYRSDVLEYIRSNNCTVFASNFLASDFDPDYIFSSNMKRYTKIQGKTKAKCIITSNMKEAEQKDYIVNFSSYISKDPDIIDNSVLMLLRVLVAIGVKNVVIAGMDGYTTSNTEAYYDNDLAHDFSMVADKRNSEISEELKNINRFMKLCFITPTLYEI